MTTVTGFTADRMLAIENTTIVGGSVVGDDLMLTPRVGSAINAGNVRGATGSPGITSLEYTDGQAAANAAIYAALAVLIPVGVILDYPNTAPPASWLAMNGQVIFNGETTYPVLWAILPASMKSGSSIVLPDTRGRVTIGLDTGQAEFDVVGETGGSKTQSLVKANLPADTVTINPPATGITGVSANENQTHQHFVGDYTGGNGIAQLAQVYNTGPNNVFGIGTASSATPNKTGAELTQHGHGAGSYQVDIAPFESNLLGSGVPHNNLQPYIVLLKIIKAV